MLPSHPTRSIPVIKALLSVKGKQKKLGFCFHSSTQEKIQYKIKILVRRSINANNEEKENIG
jgi:hypothetical protein